MKVKNLSAYLSLRPDPLGGERAAPLLQARPFRGERADPPVSWETMKCP